jgi:apoptosis-inducing factor 2
MNVADCTVSNRKSLKSNSSTVSSVSTTTTTTTILIIGGSLGGIEASRALGNSKNFSISILEKSSCFFHHDSAPRSLLSPSFAKDSLWEYKDCFLKSHVNYIQGDLIKLTNDTATLSNNTTITFKYCIISTGTSIQSIFKPSCQTRLEYFYLLDSYQQLIRNAHRIVVLGGGASGCELCAEIKLNYPLKSVTLVHSQPSLLNAYSRHTRNRLLNRLRGLGVVVVLGRRGNCEFPFINGVHNIAGIPTDLTINAVCKPKPNSNFLPQSSLNLEGYVKVDGDLRVEGLKNVFAMGDVADTRAPKMTRCLANQAKCIAYNIEAIEDGRGLKGYNVPRDDVIMVTLGFCRGVGQIALGDWAQGLVGWIVDVFGGLVKGYDLFRWMQKQKFN